MLKKNKLLLILFFILFAKVVFAAVIPPVVVNAQQKKYDLAGHMEMYLDSSHKLTLAQVSNPPLSQNFIPYSFQEQTKHKYYGMSVWLRFTVVNPLPKTVHLFLTLDFPNQYTGWDFYAQKTNKSFVKENIFPKSMHITLLPIELPPKSSQTFYLHNYSEGWLQTTFLLKVPFIHLLSVIDQYFFLGIGYGVMLALIFHSFFIYLFLRDKSYLIYVLFVLSCLYAAIMKDGLLNRLPTLVVSNWWYLHTFRLNMVFVGLTYVLFAKTILQTKQHTPRLNFLMNVYLILAIPSGIAGLAPSFGFYQVAYTEIMIVSLYTLSGVFLSLVAALTVAVIGYKPARYYLAGMFFLLFGFFVYFLMNQQLLPPNKLVFQMPQFGLDMDMILQAIALAVRFNLIQESEIKAQKQVIKQKDINAKLQLNALRQQQTLVTAYARFFPLRFLELLKKKTVVDIHLGDHVEKNMTILFGDLRNFTAILEAQTPQESFDFINSYLHEIGPVVRKHQGFIDKFIGDAILALFDRSAEDALNTAIEISNILWQRQIDKGSNKVIDMGIGIHYGSVMVGTIGEEQRMDETVISDTVNTASRLESLNKVYGTHIIITEEVFNSLVNKSEFKVRFIDHIYVKGKQVDIKIYEVFNNDSPDSIDKKLKVNDVYVKGIEHYQQGELAKALENFLHCQEVLPEDNVIQLYINRCNNFIKKPPEVWQPIAKLNYSIEIT